MEVASLCKYEGGQYTHAAAGTSMCPLSLPSVPESGLMSSGLHNTPCIRNDSIASTLVAILHSVKKLGAFVHIVREGEVNVQCLIDISRTAVGSKVCMAVEVSKEQEGGSPMHKLHTSVNDEPMEMSEEKALCTILKLQRASSTMVLYWSETLLGYSVVLNQSPSVMWAVYTSRSRAQDESSGGMQALQMSLGCVTRVLPCFYQGQEGYSMVVMGQGGTDRVPWDDLEVDMAALCDPVVQRIYCSRMPSGRCYCCQYMLNLHQEVHSEGKPLIESSTKLRLSKKFWQNTKSKDDRSHRAALQKSL